VKERCTVGEKEGEKRMRKLGRGSERTGRRNRTEKAARVQLTHSTLLPISLIPTVVLWKTEPGPDGYLSLDWNLHARCSQFLTVL